MNAGTSGLEVVPVVILAIGFLYASAADLKEREVSDRLWQVLGGVGTILGVALVGVALLPALLWVVVAALVLQHVFAWDEALGTDGERYADWIELGAYVIVVVAVALAIARWGVGPSTVPWAVIAVLATVLLARALFEVGALFGGADAKALMIAGLLVPIFATPIWPGADATVPLLRVLPFSVNLLTNAALFSLAVPIGLAVRNLRRREFSFARGFTTFSIPVSELPRRFVWIDDPQWGKGHREDDAATTAEDRARRVAASRDLTARGIRRVLVTPQVPFLLLLTLGALAALAAGNVLLDVLLLW